MRPSMAIASLIGLSVATLNGLAQESPLLVRHALTVRPESFGDAASSIHYLDQGWTSFESAIFYATNQGSRLIPYAWFMALEQPDHRQLLSDNAHLDKLRFLPRSPSELNPDGLPVGFVKDPATFASPTDWLGLTCAACHTAQINYQGRGYRVDGGPGQGDIQTLLTEITSSLKNTLTDPARFDRFADRVLGNQSGNQSRREALRDRLNDVASFRDQFDRRNASPHPYGYARVDAFGIIMNEVLQHALDLANNANQKAPNAPVSYPFLWDTPQHDKVQWNGSAPNEVLGTHKIGPLARNVGEVLGVFGEVTVPKMGSGIAGYASSAQVLNLLTLEELLRKLRSPQWPDEFPPIDAALRDQGKEMFASYCLECHRPIDRANPFRTVQAVMIPLNKAGTDPLMAMNFATRVAATGPLEGRRKSPLALERFGASASAGEILRHVVLGVIVHSPFSEIADNVLRPVTAAESAAGLEIYTTRSATPLAPAYKARPLNGIWATAPYLHNGSVPNLAQLLLPAEERTKRFYVGRREFDPVNVGFVADQPVAGAFEFRATNDAGQPISGNSNAGHEYGTGKDGKAKLTAGQRLQLIEYMKSL